jgi:hypothetical protein
MPTTKKISLNDLQINTENYRFDPLASQKEAIDKMVSDQGEKLFDLAEHIVSNGLNPNDRIQVAVSHHDKTKYIVLEGNRRVVALKLLNTPDLLDTGFSSLKKKFTKLHENNKNKIIKTFDCTLYNDPKEADVWIGVKHGYGKPGPGTDEWDPIQKGRFEEKIEGKSSIVLQTIKLLQNSSDVPSGIKTDLNKLKVTNLDRLISDPDVRDFLGIEINNGIVQSSIAKEEVIKGLTQIVKDLLKPSFKVSEIYNKIDRKDYLKSFPKESKPNKSKTAGKPWQFNGNVALTSPAPRPKRIPQSRDVLIPRSCVLTINNPKVNSLYHELQKLSITRFTNVGAIAFRAFVENSMDCYIESNKLTTTKNGKGTLNKHSSFITKISEVANHLETQKLADSNITKGIRSAANNKNDLLGIETLHAYVHNDKFSAIPINMVITWNNIQPFIEKVWANIK